MHFVYVIGEKRTKCMFVYIVRTYTIWNDAKTITSERLSNISQSIPLKIFVPFVRESVAPYLLLNYRADFD